MDSSAAKDQINTSDLTVVLRELRDSIRNQTTLLEAFITEQRTLRDAPKSSHKPSQSPSSNRSYGDDKDDDAVCEDKQTIQETAELGDRSALARRLWPLFHDRVTFWRVKEEFQTSLFGKTTIPPDLWSLLDKITPSDPHPKRGVVGNCWKYWTPFFISYATTTPKFYHREGGHPDYVPPWELRKVNDQLFHIDDVHRKNPLTISGSSLDEELIIPYSFAPPVTVLLSRPKLATTGITCDWSRIQSSLGDLYATPPDNRVPLSFERNQLRLMCASGIIGVYLDRMRKTFEALHAKGGFLIVEDHDMYGNMARYSGRSAWNRRHLMPEEIGIGKQLPDRLSYWQAAGPSLAKELLGLEVAPIVQYAKYNPNVEDGMLCTIERSLRRHTRSWFRVIHCQGLADLGQPWNNVRDLLIDDSWMEFDPVPDDSTKEAFRLHFTCNSIPKRGNPFKERWRPFHITWHAIVPAHERHYGHSWKYGRLYGTENLLIGETAFTMAIIQSAESLYFRPSQFKNLTGVSGYWTILLLTSSNYVIKTRRPNHGLGLIKQGLYGAIDAWEQLDRHFSQILDTHDTVLKPEEHDQLLFDDDTFSRSRRFFWVMDSLEVFIPEIENTILEWEYFWEESESMFRNFERHNKAQQDKFRKPPLGLFDLNRWGINEELEGIRSQIRKLKEYQARFEAYQARTRTLREGLFNASSVIESRAATRLGENVKLLTYVSIFYLPLAFCVGIWSINENYGRVSLVMTSVLVAAGTYFIVGNLENTIGALKAIYRAFKRPIVDRMAKDHDQTWSERGRAFQSFQPRREIIKPSEWYIARYWGMEILRKLRVGRETPEGSREPNEHAAPSHGERSQRMPIPPSAPNAGDGNVHPEPQPQSQPGTKVDKGKRKATVVSLV